MSTSTTAVLEQFAKSPAGLALVAEREGQVLVRRKSLVAELSRLRSEYGKASPPLQATEQKAERDLTAARDAAEMAEKALRVARDAMNGATASFDSAVTRCEGELRATSPEAISAFLDELLDLHAKSRAPGTLRSQTIFGERNPVNDLREERVLSNFASIRARLAAIIATRKAAEALQLEALSVAEVERRIGKLRAAIPVVAEELEG